MRWEGQFKTKTTRKLRKAWIAGVNDKKAAQYAGITADDLKELLRKDSKLALMRAACLTNCLETEIAARNNVKSSIKEGSVESSKWYLERKVPDEFSTKQTVSVQADDFLSIDEKKAELEKLMEKFGDA